MTPEEHALSGFGDHAAVVASMVADDVAAVLLLTDGWDEYPYLITYVREGDEWRSLLEAGGVGGGGTVYADEDRVGLVVAAGADMVDIDFVAMGFRGMRYDVPVTDGYYVWVRSLTTGDDTDDEQVRELGYHDARGWHSGEPPRDPRRPRRMGE